MNRIMRCLLGFMLVSGMTQLIAAEPDGLAPGMVHPGYHEQPTWFKQSFLDLRDDVAEARVAHKRVLLYFYQDGCPYCKKLLEDNLGQRTIADKTRKYFDVIAINMWGDREVTGLDGQAASEKQFAAAMRVMFTPTLLFLDEQGRPVLRLNGYYPPHKFEVALDYVSGKLEKKLSFRDYLEKRAPAPATGKLHDEPFFAKPPFDLARLARSGGKPLLVLFEQKQCRPCDELHEDIMQRPETRTYLDKFTVVRFDIWASTPLVTPAGLSTTAQQWAQALDIKYAPSMVFFDANGKEVFRAEAYLKAFHTQSVLDYVSSGAYREQPSLQRFIEARAEALRAKGVTIDLMK